MVYKFFNSNFKRNSADWYPRIFLFFIIDTKLYIFDKTYFKRIYISTFWNVISN